MPLVAGAVLLPFSAAGIVVFTHVVGFGSATTIQGEADRGGDLPVTVGPFDVGGEGALSASDNRTATTSAGGGRVSISSRARADLGTLGGFVSSEWAASPGTGHDQNSSGSARSEFYDTCTVESTSLSSGMPIGVALSWKLHGTFSRVTPGLNAGRVTLFLQAFHQGVQTADSVVPVSSDIGKPDLQGKLNIPDLKIGDLFIVQPFLEVAADGLLFFNFGQSGTFTSDFEASVIPVITSSGVDAHVTCRALTKARLESAQWESTHCLVPVPKDNLQVVFIPARYRGETSNITFDEITERIVYVKDYFFQQSMCSVDINPITIRGPEPDGWFELPSTRAAYDAIPPDSYNNFRRTGSIWLDAFLAAGAQEPAFLLNQQIGLDGIVVITEDGRIRSRAYITRSLAARIQIINALLEFIIPPPLQEIEQLMTGPLKDTMFRQSAVITDDTKPTSIWAHELGHALFTFWDYYGTPEPFVRGDIFEWGLMGVANNIPPPPIIAYNKQIAGWLKYKDIAADALGDYTLVPVKDMQFGDETLRYKSPKGPTDWYIFELRTSNDDVPRAPEQPFITGQWDSVSVNFATNVTVLTDNVPNPSPFKNLHSGRIQYRFQPNKNIDRLFTIQENDDSSLTIIARIDSVKPGDTYEISPSTLVGGNQTGVVIYQKWEINLLGGRTPACGSLHGFPQQSLNVLFAHEFGSCLAKINNVNAFPRGAQDRVTLTPGTSYHDDQANVEFSLSNAFVLSIKGTAISRTVVSLEASIDAGKGGFPSSVGEQLITAPVDLHLVTPDGKHVGPIYGTDEYEIGINQARVGGAYTSAQWISLPDDVPAAYVIDASQAVANAKVLGLLKLDIDATVSIRHYDANGVEAELRAPISFKLNLDQTTTGRIDIPLPGAAGSDTIAPATAASLSLQPNAADWNNSNVTLTLTATDNPGGSGVKQITYSASGAQTIANTVVAGSSASFTVDTEGITTITFFGTDNAGNIEVANTLTIKLDKTPPTITPVRSPVPNANGWNNTNVTVSFQCSDNLSGLAPGSPPAPTILSAEGANQSVGGTCTDLAGNSASAVVSGINIDKTPPSISCTANPSVLWPPNNKLVPVNVSVTVSDALSRPAGFTLVSESSNEPDSGQGDIQGFVTGTASTAGQLRAQRLGSGAGRVYMLTYRGADRAGNTTSCTTTVSVPHDQGN